MASLLRTVARQGCRILATNAPRRQLLPQQACLISTSKKHKDSATVTEQVQSTTSSEEEVDENWMSHGYSLTDPLDDEWSHNAVLFFGITVAVFGGGFILAYAPDYRLRDWSRREAYIEMTRRQSLGLPMVDPNYIDPEIMKQHLPSDEELGDTEIIV